MKTVIGRLLPAVVGCLVLAGCAGQQPAAYTGLSSSSYLKPNDQDGSGKMPFRYRTTVDWSQYHNAVIETVAVYGGPDNQFGKMSDQDRQALARYTQTALTKALAKRFALINDPIPGTVRIKMTLTGAAGSAAVISSVAHLDIGGNLYNGIQAIRGKEGLMTGWVMYAVEISDASNGKLLEAYEEKQYPNAFNPLPTFGALAAAKTGIDKGSDALVVQMQQP
ncbi:DUF3313 domain-containing protein [Acidisoma cellulosilytica]|uniref:DUF3313 domain-containing protein n=1 Tax=Acidisoma cellulosilyticum TaxID=2802395 RepID=A0A963YZY5_9PROT|nr:DUF3313 domain-containing protein [Acidisoma cellulosilyticum]MCB8880176.1 DUF3313 domain-containing protein [Acidisoma cellulosilyticum]